ncbi:MAG: VOC family protein, partial [Dehalococcoidia bacterium]
LFDSPAPRLVTSEEMGLRAAFIEQGETHIELLESLRPDTAIAKFIEKYGEGIHHMAFTVGDVDAKVKQLLEAGIPMLDQVPREGLGGRIAFAHPSATHGVLIEIITPRDSH